VYNHNLYNSAQYNADAASPVAPALRATATLTSGSKMQCNVAPVLFAKAHLSVVGGVYIVAAPALKAEASLSAFGVRHLVAAPFLSAEATLAADGQTKVLQVVALNAQSNLTSGAAVTSVSQAKVSFMATLNALLIKRALPPPGYSNIRVIRGPRPTATK
jgi:hypothetical protein